MLESGMKEINAYLRGEPAGYVLLVNTENDKIYGRLRSRLLSDENLRFLSVSDLCPPDTLPNADDLRDFITEEGKFVLAGLSQLLMLQSAEAVRKQIGILLQLPIRGHAVVLLEHCEQECREQIHADRRTARQMLLIPGERSVLPRIHVVKKREDIIGGDVLTGVKSLLAWLEKPTSAEITVVTRYTIPFQNAVYSVTTSGGVYETLIRVWPELRPATEKTYGTEAQWRSLAKRLQESQKKSQNLTATQSADQTTLARTNLTALAQAEFGSVDHLSAALPDALSDPDRFWLLWLCMKIFGIKENLYLARAVENSCQAEELEEHIYLDLLEIRRENSDFARLYRERKLLLQDLPENLSLLHRYCERVGRYEKDAVYYLTDNTREEELEFLRCVYTYEYSPDEIHTAAEAAFPELALYLRKFDFNALNTILPEQENNLHRVLTEYFTAYKFQKVINRIEPEFESKVEEYAKRRIYNQLQSRSAIVRQLSKDSAQLFFFDALGVEYLSYIQAKCDAYGLSLEIHIGHGNLPSITSANKDFSQYFPAELSHKIDELDELKHHSQVLDYQKCKLPIHLFRELELIDAQLRAIQSRLIQGAMEKAVVVSDHGASRLAVIREQWDSSDLRLDEKAEHSGRCCQTDHDPQIPFATFEQDSKGKTWAVLANYGRFQGGRRANVEVHGGASLEEILVPVLIITKMPEELELCFTNSVIELRQKDVAALTLFSNQPIQKPRMRVEIREGEWKFYDGEFVGDQKHTKFTMPELKRSKTFSAEIYDGERKLTDHMTFRIQKRTARENDFGLGL